MSSRSVLSTAAAYGCLLLRRDAAHHGEAVSFDTVP
jgi:hypothetical protein